jgi:hypothetical protein
MELIVGTNSYVTVEEANDYISTHYLSIDEFRKNWDALTNSDDKAAALIKSTQALNNLKYIGKQKNPRTQGNFQFPRINNLFNIPGTYTTLYDSQYYDSQLIQADGDVYGQNGMIAIKEATIENALAYINMGNIINTSRINSAGGIKSRRAGSVSESYDTKSKETKQALNGIYTPLVDSILVDWLVSSAFAI